MENTFTVTGTVATVLPVASGISQATGNEWQSQELVLLYTDHAGRERRCALSIFGADRIAAMMPAVGAFVRVTFAIDAREHNGRYYTRHDVLDVTPISTPQQ